MLITAITHAEARGSDHTFRGLTRAGMEECRQAAARYLDLTRGSSHPPIARILSSPKPRCLETVLLFTKVLPDELLTTSGLDVMDGLRAGSIEGGELARLAEEGDDHILVSGHADLARTLPEAMSLVADAVSDGWFQLRPVLFQIESTPGQPWAQARIRFCEGIVDGKWRDLISPR